MLELFRNTHGEKTTTTTKKTQHEPRHCVPKTQVVRLRLEGSIRILAQLSSLENTPDNLDLNGFPPPPTPLYLIRFIYFPLSYITNCNSSAYLLICLLSARVVCYSDIYPKCMLNKYLLEGREKKR